MVSIIRKKKTNNMFTFPLILITRANINDSLGCESLKENVNCKAIWKNCVL